MERDRITETLIARILVESFLANIASYELSPVDLALELTARSMALMLHIDIEEARAASLITWKGICANITERASSQKGGGKVIPFPAYS